MPLTARQLNRATLARQLLLRREPIGVVDAVRRVVALQAQEPASPYVALWNRVAPFDPAELDSGFASGSIVKATLMRITLHAVARNDYPAFRDAMQRTLRAARLADSRFTRSGLSTAEADELVPELVEFLDRPRMKAQIETFLRDRIGERGPGVWWALRTYAPLLHAPTGGPWSFGQRPSFVAAPAPLRSESPDEPVQRLIRRYLEGFGPASVADVAQFALIPRSVARSTLDSMNDIVRLGGANGAELFDVPDGATPEDDTPAPPRLLGMWDSVLLAYADRSRVIPADLRQLVIRQNGDVLPTLLVDGQVAGVWRPVHGAIEATSLQPLSGEAWRGLEEEARGLVAFLAGRDPRIYSRFAHWWAKLPAFETRLLPG